LNCSRGRRACCACRHLKGERSGLSYLDKWRRKRIRRMAAASAVAVGGTSAPTTHGLPDSDVRSEADFVADMPSRRVNIRSMRSVTHATSCPRKGTALHVFHGSSGELRRALSLLQGRGYDALPPSGCASESGSSAHACGGQLRCLSSLCRLRAVGRTSPAGLAARRLPRANGWHVDAVDILLMLWLKHVTCGPGTRDACRRTVTILPRHPAASGAVRSVTIFRYLHRPTINATVHLLRLWHAMNRDFM